MHGDGPWRLGLGGSDHDFSAAIMRGNDVRIAIEQERLTRVRGGQSLWYREPMRPAVEYCLADQGIDLDAIDVVAASDTIPARTRIAYAGRPRRLFSHHLCHAASAYMMLPAGCRAAILVWDGYGSITGIVNDDQVWRETMSFHIFSDEGLRCLGTTSGPAYREQDDFPSGVGNSVGMLYEAATQVIGYEATDAGKTMGLAAYGTPARAREIMDFVTLGTDPSDCLHCATHHSEIIEWMEAALRRGGGGFQAKADLAAAVQEVVHIILGHAISLIPLGGLDAIALSGGCGLNTVANAKLSAMAPGGLPVIVPPHCGDAGLGLGALWLQVREERGSSPVFSFNGEPLSPALSRPGRVYDLASVAAAANAFYPRVTIDPAVTSAQDVASLVAKGNVLGIFNGRSEIGPRALGGRSIVADPRCVRTRERINRSMKEREPFRPLAPIVLSSHYAEWFEDERQMDSFMMKVARATDRCRHEAPAILHVDGTARVQVIGEDGDPWLLRMLQGFFERTGLPLLVNTSFNRRGEPIVETPMDAMDAFLGLGLDGLWMDGSFFRAADILC